MKELIIKNWIILITSIMIMILVNTSFGKLKLIDKISVIVNNDIILQSEVDFLTKFIKLNSDQTMEDYKQSYDETKFNYQVLEELIRDKIVLQIAQEIGLTISDEQLHQTIINIAKQNHMSFDEMKEYLIYKGIDYSRYRNKIKNDVIISQVYNHEVNPRIVILPEEIETLSKKIYNDNIEVNLDQISIFLPKYPTLDQISKARNQAYSIVNQVIHEKNFSKLETIYLSKYKSLKIDQIGWKRIHELPSIFFKEIKLAKKNSIIGPLQSNVGFHILKVNDFRNLNNKFLVTEFHIRHILFKSSAFMTDEKIQENLNKIANNIKNKKISFFDAAKKFSQDYTSAKKGGDLGWVQENIYDSSIRNTLRKLNRNQISKPIHSSIGWHLIELLNIRYVDKTDIIRKEQAYRILFHKKFSKEIKNWLKEQRESAYVKVLNYQ